MTSIGAAAATPRSPAISPGRNVVLNPLLNCFSSGLTGFDCSISRAADAGTTSAGCCNSGTAYTGTGPPVWLNRGTCQQCVDFGLTTITDVSCGTLCTCSLRQPSMGS